MPRPNLPAPPEQIVADLVVDEWDPTAVHGYDPADGPAKDTHLPTATSLDNTGAHYPSLVVTPSNQTAAGETTYDFLTDSGPGQTRTGSVLATVRAQDDRGYRDDVDAEQLVHDIRAEVERIILETATGGSTPFAYIGSQPAADAPDDLDAEPPVRISQVEIRFSWLRS